jgi:CBS domain-containing protein
VRRVEKTIAECIARADFVAVAPSDPVATAVAGMREKGTHCALVVEGGLLIGIFTERDFLNRIAADRRDPGVVTMREVMTPKPEALRAHDAVAYAIHQMAVRKFRNVPVVDSEGRPTSVLNVRLVMMHLLKVFAEIDQDGDDEPADYVDLGGG